jgi:hypothetical protein
MFALPCLVTKDRSIAVVWLMIPAVSMLLHAIPNTLFLVKRCNAGDPTCVLKTNGVF